MMTSFLPPIHMAAFLRRAGARAAAAMGSGLSGGPGSLGTAGLALRLRGSGVATAAVRQRLVPFDPRVLPGLRGMSTSTAPPLQVEQEKEEVAVDEERVRAAQSMLNIKHDEDVYQRAWPMYALRVREYARSPKARDFLQKQLKMTNDAGDITIALSAFQSNSLFFPFEVYAKAFYYTHETDRSAFLETMLRQFVHDNPTLTPAKGLADYVRSRRQEDFIATHMPIHLNTRLIYNPKAKQWCADNNITSFKTLHNIKVAAAALNPEVDTKYNDICRKAFAGADVHDEYFELFKEFDRIRDVQIEAPLADASKAVVALTAEQSGLLKEMLNQFRNNPECIALADEVGVPSTIFQETHKTFVKHARQNPGPFLHAIELFKQDQSVSAPLQELYEKYVSEAYREQIFNHNLLKEHTDFRLPHTWFPVARVMKRKIIYHMGPTNSGKTFEALRSLSRAGTGIYCSPLRLLALEISEKLTAQGTPCNLLTGQEVREVPGASHLACTIEMSLSSLDQNVRYEVAVIDEVQLIGDSDRGWAWSYALLGLCAGEIHVCGDPSARDLVKRLCEVTGDDFEDRTYIRRTPLTVSRPLNLSLHKISEGDCIVAFTRKDLFRYKAMVEAATKKKSSIVYGRLPPEVRAQQARMFNDPTSGSNILVASDAIGMGLNLNIKRIIFTTLKKFDGKQKRHLSASEIKQIAGRAGRSGTRFEIGEVTCFDPADMPLLHAAMDAPVKPTEKAGLMPHLKHMEIFARVYPGMKLSAIMDFMASLAQLDGNYFMCNYEDFKTLADELHQFKDLTLEQRYQFCTAPVQVNNEFARKNFVHFAECFHKKQEVTFPLLEENLQPILSDIDLEVVQSKHNVAEVYTWLGLRLNGFSQADQVMAYQKKLAAMMEDALHAHWHVRSNSRSYGHFTPQLKIVHGDQQDRQSFGSHRPFKRNSYHASGNGRRPQGYKGYQGRRNAPQNAAAPAQSSI